MQDLQLFGPSANTTVSKRHSMAFHFKAIKTTGVTEDQPTGVSKPDPGFTMRAPIVVMLNVWLSLI